MKPEQRQLPPINERAAPTPVGIVLAAGSGSRLYPVTRGRPKPTLPWAPAASLFEHAVLSLRALGVGVIACNAYHAADVVEAHAAKSQAKPIIVRRESRLRGPAGSLHTFADLIMEHQTAVVISGDVVYDGDLAEMLRDHFNSGALLTIGLTTVADGSQFGVFETDLNNHITRYSEKPEDYQGRPATVSSGIYIVDAGLLKLIDEDIPNDFLADVLPRFSSIETELRLFPLTGPWRDLGTPSDYRHGLLEQVRREKPPVSRSASSVWVSDGAFVALDAELIGTVYVGGGARIGHKAMVRDSVILDMAVVPDGASITEGIVAGSPPHDDNGSEEEERSHVDPQAPTDPLEIPSRWNFTNLAPKTFTDHMSASIPGYLQGHALIRSLAPHFMLPDTRVIEGGTATGELFTILSEVAGRVPGVSLCGFDIEESMVTATRERNSADNHKSATIEQGNASAYDYTNASLIVMYYTLQFLPPAQKQACISRMVNGLVPGGVVIIFEKTLLPNSRGQNVCSLAYAQFKEDSGITSQEILAKATSLRGVMHSETLDTLMTRFRKEGIEDFMQIFQYLGFCGIIATKPCV
jgi:NDP-sugar pyrophosphorylase family protein/ubiquinone/menaquinone biosynthesis C-methylase UbiE